MPALLAEVHGWKVYTAGFCSRTGELVLVEPSGKHVHTAESARAICSEEEHPEWDLPAIGCSCGFQSWFDIPSSEDKILGHVLALGYTMIHESGWRTAKYVLESLVLPSFTEIRVIGDSTADAKTFVTEVASKLKLEIKPFPDCEHCHLEVKDHPSLGREVVKMISIPEYK